MHENWIWLRLKNCCTCAPDRVWFFVVATAAAFRVNDLTFFLCCWAHEKWSTCAWDKTERKLLQFKLRLHLRVLLCCFLNCAVYRCRVWGRAAKSKGRRHQHRRHWCQIDMCFLLSLLCYKTREKTEASRVKLNIMWTTTKQAEELRQLHTLVTFFECASDNRHPKCTHFDCRSDCYRDNCRSKLIFFLSFLFSFSFFMS